MKDMPTIEGAVISSYTGNVYEIDLDKILTIDDVKAVLKELKITFHQDYMPDGWKPLYFMKKAEGRG